MCLAALPLLATAAGSAGTMATAATVASTAMSAIGSIQEGNASAAAARADAKVARMNARMIDDQIADERIRAGDENRRLGEEAAATIGSQKVGIASGNLDMTFGSPLRALIASTDAAARDAGHLMDNSARATRDMRQQQANYRTSAASSDRQVKGLRRAGYLQAVGTVLGGASKYYGEKAKVEIK